MWCWSKCSAQQPLSQSGPRARAAISAWDVCLRLAWWLCPNQVTSCFPAKILIKIPFKFSDSLSPNTMFPNLLMHIRFSNTAGCLFCICPCSKDSLSQESFYDFTWYILWHICAWIRLLLLMKVFLIIIHGKGLIVHHPTRMYSGSWAQL